MQRFSRRLDALQEWILPSESFAHSATPEKDLRDARRLLNAFYTFMLLVFLGCLIRLLLWTRTEVLTTTIKVDYVEAPSLAICPFEVNTSIVPPGTDFASWVTVTKHSVNEDKQVQPSIEGCNYDRECICVDLSQQFLKDVTVDATASDRSNANDVQSVVRNGFVETLVVQTKLGDPSTRNALMLGFYDSVDHIPTWFHANEGSFCDVQLELRFWYAVSLTVRSLFAAVRYGSISPVVWRRHMFRITAQDVNPVEYFDGTPRRSMTTINYGMRNFFVDESVSSENAISIYNLAILMLLLLMQSTLTNYFFNAMFPVDDPQSKEVQKRRLSWASQELAHFCCCVRRRHEPPDEHSPLV